MAEISSLPPKDVADQSAPETTRGGIYFTPRVDIFETDDELVLVADVPGVRPEDVDLRYEKGELVLHARVRPRHAEQRCLLNEYGEGDFYRAFSVHESIDSTRISAECKDGVLKVHLPKAEPVKPRKINVRGQ
jgi:HSP20 family protein